MMRCPVCKAENASGPACRRCKADLTMLSTIEEQRTAAMRQARQAFIENRLDDALRHAQDANSLRQGADAQQWLAILHLLAENFGEAWGAYHSTKAHA